MSETTPLRRAIAAAWESRRAYDPTMPRLDEVADEFAIEQLEAEVLAIVKALCLPQEGEPALTSIEIVNAMYQIIDERWGAPA